MPSAGQSSTVMSARYADALIELATDSKNLDKVAQDLQDLQAMIKGSADLAFAIRSPLLDQDTLKGAMNALADKAKFQDVTKNFLGVLVQNRRLYALEKIIECFKRALATRRGEVSIDVQVAQDLTPSQKKELEAALSKAIGSDVAVQLKVEPAIMGGMIVTMGSKMIDNSVRRKLEKLRVAMSAQSNENTNSNLSEVV